MPVRLISLDGRENIALDLVLVVVGRHPDSDARIDSSRVSKRHCCLMVDREGVRVRDLGSRNGTRINGQRIRLGLIRRGDELRIAHLRYRLETNDPAAETVLAQVRDRDARGPGAGEPRAGTLAGIPRNPVSSGPASAG